MNLKPQLKPTDLDGLPAIDITLDNSIVVDSEWFVGDNTPHPCLISYKSKNMPATVTDGVTPLPGGYKYYVSWYVSAERNKIPLPTGGSWVCLASINHATHFDAVNRAESLKDAAARVCGIHVSKEARNRFVKERFYFNPNEADIEYSRSDAEITWQLFVALMGSSLGRLKATQFWSIVAHSNMYTYSSPDRYQWLQNCESKLAANKILFDRYIDKAVAEATPENNPGLNWDIMPQKNTPVWQNKKLTVNCNEMGYLLDVRDKDGVRLKVRSKAGGGWYRGECKLFSKGMLEHFASGDVVVPDHYKPIIDLVVKESFYTGIRSALAYNMRFNTTAKTFQNVVPKGALSGRMTSPDCLLFPKNTTKDNIGYDVRNMYHNLPPGLFQVGYDFGAQEALIFALINLMLGDSRFYDRATSGSLHDENAADWGVPRPVAKAGLFAAIYGASAELIATTLNIPFAQADAIQKGVYGGGGLGSSYLAWLKRNEKSPVSIWYKLPMNLRRSGLHLQKNAVIQHTGNCMVDYVVAKLHCEGYQLSQTVHDELWFITDAPLMSDRMSTLKRRLSELYHDAWLKLATRLGLDPSVVNLPCFRSSAEVVNVGLQKFRPFWSDL